MCKTYKGFARVHKMAKANLFTLHNTRFALNEIRFCENNFIIFINNYLLDKLIVLL